MQLPFTSAQFFEVFRRYNEADWPAQLLLLVGGLAALALTFRSGGPSARAVGAILALLWLWMGVVYHIVFFAAINPAAIIFGSLFVAQGLLFAWFGVWSARLKFSPPRDASGVTGALLIAYALVVYPVIGLIIGHRYPAAPTFGLPCPTTIFTFGLLLWIREPVPRSLVIIPALWAVIGSTAALRLGVPQDYGLFVAGAVAVPLILLRGRQATAERMA